MRAEFYSNVQKLQGRVDLWRKKEKGIAVSVKMMVVSSEYISLVEDWEV